MLFLINPLILSCFSKNNSSFDKKTHKKTQSMKPACHVFTDSGCLVSNHEPRIAQINKAPPSNHTVGERLKETGGTLNGCSGWHLVLENWVSANSRARPLTSVRKRVQSSEVIVDNGLCSVHVGGNKCAHYTGTDNPLSMKQKHTDWDRRRIRFLMNYALFHFCTYTSAMFTDSLQNFFVRCELAANLYRVLSSRPQTACKEDVLAFSMQMRCTC